MHGILWDTSYFNISYQSNLVSNTGHSNIDNYAEILIDDLYMKTLRRPADMEGLNHFSALLESKKKSLEDIKKMIFASDEYKALPKN